MSAWERWAKRFFKGLVFALVYVGTAMAVGLTPSWPLLAVVVATGFASSIMDALLPTHAD